MLGISPGCSHSSVRAHAASVLGQSLDPRPEFLSRVQAASETLCSFDPIAPHDASSVLLRMPFQDILRMRRLTFTHSQVPGCGWCKEPRSSCTDCMGVGRIPGDLMRMVTGNNSCPLCGGSGRSACANKSSCSKRLESSSSVLVDMTADLATCCVSTIRCARPSTAGATGALMLTVEVTGVPAGAHASSGVLSLPLLAPVPTLVLGGVHTVSGLGQDFQIELGAMSGSVVHKPEWSSLPIEFRIQPKIPQSLTAVQRRLYAELLKEEQSISEVRQ